MRRRDFIAGLGGAAAWPLAARAQQDSGPARRIGMLIAGGDSDPQFLARLAAFRETLAKLGWEEGRNLRTELRFGTGSTDRIRANASELVTIAPELLVVSSTAAARALRQLSQSVPIVFVTIGDPVASGLVRNLARPDGNATGFMLHEPSLGGKWVELLKEAAPQLVRIAHIFDPSNVPDLYFGPIETAARTLAIQLIRIPVQTAIDIVRAVDAFAMEPDGGLLSAPDNTIALHRETIIRLASQHRLPSIFSSTYYAEQGALMSYGLDFIDQYRRAAFYVDRFLRGTKLIELPVQLPTQFELAINLSTAKAIGLTLPDSLLLRADKVIE